MAWVAQRCDRAEKRRSGVEDDWQSASAEICLSIPSPPLTTAHFVNHRSCSHRPERNKALHYGRSHHPERDELGPPLWPLPPPGEGRHTPNSQCRKSDKALNHGRSHRPESDEGLRHTCSHLPEREKATEFADSEGEDEPSRSR